MGVLVIKCPNTGREVSTGIQTDTSTFARMPNEILETRCPHCRTKHSWRPRDAMLFTRYRLRTGLKTKNSWSGEEQATMCARNCPVN